MKKPVAKALKCRDRVDPPNADTVDWRSGDEISSAGLHTAITTEEDGRNRNPTTTEDLPAARTKSEPASHHIGPPARPGAGTSLPVNFGCKWDSADFSCAYDCVFTALTWLYLHATDAWRRKWIQESATADFLSGHFRKIMTALSSPMPDRTVPALFVKGRDELRDRLFQRNPTMFPRRGPRYASVTYLLQVLADDRSPSYYATAILSCGTAGCPLLMKNLKAKYYILTPSGWNTSTGIASPPYHESLETWIKKHYSSPTLTKTADRCMQCRRQLSRRLVFRKSTWFWFEVFPEFRHVVIPAFKVSLGSATFRLATVIYFNGNHYRARVCDPSGSWWFYDGQRYEGHPRPSSRVFSERDLFWCGSGFNVTALVYCLMD